MERLTKLFKRDAGVQERVEYPEIALNDAAVNAEQDFKDNYISTTKYTLLTFVPVRLDDVRVALSSTESESARSCRAEKPL